MKILFVCENYYPHYGGAETLFKNLAESFVEKGFQSTVLTHRLRNTVKSEKVNSVEVHRVSSFFSRYVFSFSSLLKAVQLARKHDVVQTTTFNGAFPAWVAAKLTGKPAILTVHEVWQGKWQEITGFSRWKSKLHGFLESLIYKLPFDHYICVSEATKKDLMGVLEKKKKTLQEKISVVYNGLDYDFWKKENCDQQRMKEFRKKYGLENKKVFFSWGRPGPSKGFEFLVQAIPAVIERFPETVLLLMFGSKEKYPQKYKELLKIIQDTNSLLQRRKSSQDLILSESIFIIDSLPHEELRNIVALADTIVIPSIAEGFGYTALEAMALEKPVILSNAGSLPEVAGGKHLVFQKKNVQDLAEKMLLALQRKWNFSTAKKFSWKECVEGYRRVYAEI